MPVGAPGNLDSAVKIGTLHRAEAAAVHALNQLVPDLEEFQHYWQTLKTQHLTSENFVSKPVENPSHTQLDYKENNTSLLGPDEGGDWHWATAREQVFTRVAQHTTYINQQRKIMFSTRAQAAEHTRNVRKRSEEARSLKRERKAGISHPRKT